MIALRPVESEADVEAFLDVRRRVDPEFPVTRDSFQDGRERPDRIDVLAALDGEVAGAAWAHLPRAAGTDEFLYVSVRVVPEGRRRGVGTALFGRVSEHARALRRRRLYTVVRHDDRDSLAYLGTRGFEELTRMEERFRDLAVAAERPEPPEGVAVVPLAAEHERGAWEVAQEAETDVPSPDTVVVPGFEEWRARELGPLVRRELSFVALEAGAVIGYATIGVEEPGRGLHHMTGVARRARGRGVARALKAAQIEAAHAAGLVQLRTQNDVANAAMRRVNERLGYSLRLAWIHLGGPLLG